jgi:riboflavin biosynthesis pyrimidine reductase
MVGAGTGITDDPSLTDRSQRARRRPLIRAVLDERLQMPGTSQLSQRSGTPVPLFSGASSGARSQPQPISTLKAWRSFTMRPVDVMLLECSKNSVAVQFKVLLEGGGGVAGPLWMPAWLTK